MKQVRFKTHSFTLVLKGLDDLTEEMADRIIEAGCDDCTPGLRIGAVRLEFDRKAESLDKAVRSAVAQLKAAGFDPRLEK